MKYTADEVRKLDRPVLESRFLQLQALRAASISRLVTARQRAVLIQQHVNMLVEFHDIPKDKG